MNATDSQLLAHRFLDVLNGADTAQLAGACAPGVTVFATVVEENLDPFTRRDMSRLGEFVAAWRNAMPDIRFALGRVDAGNGVTTVHWTANGTHTRAIGYVRPTGGPIALRGVCVFRCAADRVTEIRLAPDVYDFLLRTGTICADPATTRGRAPEVNAAGMAWLRAATAERRDAVSEPVDATTLLHANVQFYASAAMDQRTFELHGPGRFSQLLGFLRDEFASVDLRVGSGISQGHTTTFRGRAVVEREGERFGYLLRCGFRTTEARVAESWFEIYVPPTLHEVFA